MLQKYFSQDGLVHPSCAKWDKGPHKGKGDIFTANATDLMSLSWPTARDTETLHLSLATPPSDRTSGDAKIRARPSPTQPSLCDLHSPS